MSRISSQNIYHELRNGRCAIEINQTFIRRFWATEGDKLEGNHPEEMMQHSTHTQKHFYVNETKKNFFE